MNHGIDWGHLLEVVLGGLFTAGVAWGTLRASVKHLDYKIDAHIANTQEWRVGLGARLDTLEKNVFSFILKRGKP